MKTANKVWSVAVCAASLLCGGIITHPAKPYKNMTDVVKVARTKPDTVTYGTIGAGSLGHLALALAGQTGGFNIVHVPYKGVTAYAWWGIFTTARTPPLILKKFHGEVFKVLDQPDVRKHLGEQLGMDLVVSSPEELRLWTANELARWGRVIRDNNIKP